MRLIERPARGGEVPPDFDAVIQALTERIERSGHVQGTGEIGFVFAVDLTSTPTLEKVDFPTFKAFAGPLGFDSTAWRMPAGPATVKAIPPSDQERELDSALDRFLEALAQWDRHGLHEPADEGVRLLRSITAAEHAAIERILGILGEAQTNKRLTSWQENQIILMADLIRETRNKAVPDKTERSKVAPVVAGALAYLFLQIPDGIIKWNDAIPILQGIDWQAAVAMLGG